MHYSEIRLFFIKEPFGQFLKAGFLAVHQNTHPVNTCSDIGCNIKPTTIKTIDRANCQPGTSNGSAPSSHRCSKRYNGSQTARGLSGAWKKVG